MMHERSLAGIDDGIVHLSRELRQASQDLNASSQRLRRDAEALRNQSMESYAQFCRIFDEH